MNIIKKVIGFILAFTLIFTLVSCSGDGNVGQSGEAENPDIWKAGTYTGIGIGMHGEVQVEVTFSKTAITKVEVKENSESEDIAAPAIEKMPAAIIEAQSLEVEMIAGATMTSNAIIMAVADAMSQAQIEIEEAS